MRSQTNMHSDESQNITCHGCIFTELPPILQRSVKMNIFTWDSEPNYRMLKITSERWQHYYIIFTQRLIDQLTLAIFVASFANGDHSKMCKSPYMFQIHFYFQHDLFLRHSPLNTISISGIQSGQPFGFDHWIWLLSSNMEVHWDPHISGIEQSGALKIKMPEGKFIKTQNLIGH